MSNKMWDFHRGESGGVNCGDRRIASHHETTCSSILKLARNLLAPLRSMSQAEVIQEWADSDGSGASFERGRMEKNIQEICIKHPAGVPSNLRDPRKGLKLKQADIQSLVRGVLRIATHIRLASSSYLRTRLRRRSSAPAVTCRKPNLC